MARNENETFQFENKRMKKRILRPLVATGFLVLLAVVFSGCTFCKAGKPGPFKAYTVEVALDDSLKTSSVIVDLVGVNKAGLARWEAYDMAKYWKEGDPMRNDARKTVLNFVSGQSLSQKLDATDPLWQEWKKQGVTHVLVLADLPGSHVSKPGNQDARRQILPVDKCSWPGGTKVLNVQVQRSGIVVLTPSR